ncbi:MAG TPA: CARDB domain-containing protein [Thermoanaerobaculia bacterium]|nr:CARDB domain-containing protein [Thermoanaerobaculia bacterium]
MKPSASLVLWLLGAVSVPANAQGQASAQATFLEWRGSVAVVELLGDFDVDQPDEGGTAARQEVARALYEATPDDFDFLAALTTFDYQLDADPSDGVEAIGRYLDVRNDTSGLGLELFDHSADYGSASRLQGFIDLGPMQSLEVDPHRPGFDGVLRVLAHELMHRWGVHVRFRGADGAASTELLGHQGVHWHPLADTSRGTLMYGNHWQDLGDGRFRAGLPRDAFHPFDLYLAGFVEPEEVPPLRLLRTSDPTPGWIPRSGLELQAEAIEVSIDDVIAVEGPRDPPASSAQRRFRLGFVLVTRPGDDVTESQVAAIERMGRELETRWSILTGGRSVIHAAPPLSVTELEPGTPNPVAGGPLRLAPAAVADALAWLRSRQGDEGFWEDLPATRMRDTGLALDVLRRLDPFFDRTSVALTWLATAHPASTDALARQLLAFRAAGGAAPSELVAALRARQNADGGWGLGAGLASDPLDTALAVLALGPEDPSLAAGIAYLERAQGSDGSWGTVAGGPGRIPATALALRALSSSVVAPATVSLALDWLASRQNADGGFGDSPSTSHDTAWALATLLAQGGIERAEAGEATAYLAARQSVEGSWDGSVHTTALVADTIQRLVFPNLRFAALPSSSPDPAFDGDGVVLSALVNNDGGTVAPASLLEVFEGDPESGAASIGSCPVPALSPGASAACEVVWDTTGRAGNHRLIFLLDPAGELAELSETDNRTELEIEIGVSPTGVDLEVRANEVLVVPASPSTLPSTLTVTAIVRNNGQTEALDVVVRLTARAGTAEEVVGIEALPLLPARSSLPVAFAFELTRAGSTHLDVEADPEGAISEAREDNNRATVTVTTTPSLDLEVTESDMEVVGVPLPGATVTLRATLRNRGTVDASNVELLLALESGVHTGEPDRVVLLDQVVQISAGTAITLETPWTVDREGELELAANLDPRNLVPESNEDNNEARLRFVAGALGQPNLRFVTGTLVIIPEPVLEGAPLTAGARLESNGGAVADPVVVALFDGHPAQGGLELARAELPALLPGEGHDVELLVAGGLNGPQDRVLFLVADPDAALAEAVEDDNVLFQSIAVLGLADLALGSGSLRLDPFFPLPGHAVTLEIEVANLGDQEAAPAIVEVFGGDPLAGAPLLASALLAALPPGAAGLAAPSWTLAADAEPGRPLELVVVVDRANLVRERSKANNRATLETVIGGSSSRVAERWFSPNGDGVKDTTAFFFEVPDVATSVRVEVRDAEGRLVLRSNEGVFEGAASGSFPWDGRDRHGRLARDGDYTFHLLDAGENELARAKVTLDTDRSALLEAAGTAFEHTVDLSCQIPAGASRELAWTADERWVFFEAGTGPQHGVYRVRVDGSGLQRIPEAGLTDLAVSESGRYLAFRGTQSVSFVDLVAGGSALGVDLPSRPSRLVGFVPGGESIVVLVDERVLRVAAATGEVEAVFSASVGARLLSLPDAMSIASPLPGELVRGFSGDGSALLVVRENPGGARSLIRLHLGTGQGLDLGPFSSGDASTITAVAWLGATRVALGRSGARAIEIVDPSGGSLGVFALPPDLAPPSDVLLDGALVPMPDGLVQEPPLVATLFAESGGGSLLVQITYPIGPPDGACFVNGARQTYWRFELGLGTWHRVDRDSPPPLFTCGSFHVETWAGGGFVERGVVRHGLRYRESAIELTDALPDARGELRVRVRQQGTENAHLDSLLLDVDGARLAPVSARRVDGGTEGDDAAAVLAALDDEVLEVGGATIEAIWQLADEELRSRVEAGSPIRILLAGREENLSARAARPVELPAARDGAYELVLRAEGSLVVDGRQTADDRLGEPLFREWVRPDTGHPRAEVLGWVLTDGERIYAALDFTADNTRDVDGDWGALLLDTGSGWRELRVTERETTWGRAGFGTTGTVRYRHRYYELSASLAELGLSVGDSVRVRFAAYGTAALLDDEPATSFHDLRSLGFVGDREHLLFESLELGEPSLGVMLERDRLVPLFADWNRARTFALSPSGRLLFFRSRDRLESPDSLCVGINEEVMVLSSLANATAQLDARLTGGGGVQLSGIASDLNFRRYTLEYAPVEDPEGWRLLAPPSERQVLDGPLGLWTPPAAGSYRVRLTVEDRAGNVARAERPVAVAAPPDLTDLGLAPRLISPNGDGVADELVVSYRVLRPVLVRIEIRDATRRVVRAFDRSHPLAGESVELRWDGRDSRGLFVSDGAYSVAVAGLELFFDVDRTPPEVTTSSSHDGNVPLAGHLSIRVRDQHLDQGPLGVVESGVGDPPAVWTLVEELESVEPDRSGRVEEARFEIPLTRNALLGRRFRVDVHDAAGNRTVVLTDPIAEGVFTVASGPDRYDLTSGSFPLEPTSASGLHGPEPGDAPGDPCFADPSWPWLCWVSRFPTAGALRLRVQTTLAVAPAQVFLQFRPFDWDQLGAAEAGLLWSEREISMVFPPEGVTPIAGFPLDGFDLVWDLAGLDRDRLTVVRMRVVDTGGVEHFSGAFRLAPSRGLLLIGRLDHGDPQVLRGLPEVERQAYFEAIRALAREAGYGDGRDGELLWGIENLDGPVESAELFLRSDDDGRYHAEARFEAAAIADRVFLFEAPTIECATYEARLRAVDGAGKVRITSSVVEIPCLRVAVTLDPPPEPVCGSVPGAASRLGLTVMPSSLDGASLKQLRVELEHLGTRRILDNRNAPESGVEQRFALDLSEFAEGEYRLVVSLTNVRDDVRSEVRRVFVDRTPPVLEVTSPTDALAVCGALRIEGRAHDAVSGLRLELELAEAPEGSTCSTSSLYTGGADPNDGGWAVGLLTGELGRISSCEGEIEVRLIAYDRAGNTTCVDRRALVDSAVVGSGVSVLGVPIPTTGGALYQGLSPNGDGVADELSILLATGEPSFVSLEVFAQSQAPGCKDPLAAVGSAVRSLTQALPLSPGSTTVVWDGLDEAGVPAPDGIYGVVARFEDGCRNRRTETFCSVVVDSSGPSLEVVAPAAGNDVAGIADVRGSVVDVRPALPALGGLLGDELLSFADYQLDYRLDALPDGFAPIAAGDRERTALNGHLASWRLGNVAGPVTLRLRAADVLGNRSEVRVPVRAVDVAQLVSELEPVPRLFSPNGDGRRDQTAIRFALEQPAIVDLHILDAGVLVRALAAGEALSAGSAVRTWDGLSGSGAVALDGEYEVELIARLQEQPAVSQTVRTVLLLDATPPSLSVTRPDTGFVASGAEVAIEVADQQPASWTLELAAGASVTPAAWQPLAAGVGVVSGTVARLEDLAEGAYRLRLSATDQAESQSVLEVPLVVDTTSPVVTWLAPAEGSSLQDEFVVTARIDESHRGGYRIEIAPGLDPSVESFSLLVDASGDGSAEVSRSVDLGDRSEGPWTLRLLARDLAGNSGEARARVRIDRSPPRVDIASPASGAWVRQPVDVRGEATDLNLASWSLLLRGAGAGSTGLAVVLQSGEEPVGPDGVFLIWTALPPDGEYELVLSASDHAGHEATAAVAVNVDRTPPAMPAGFTGEVQPGGGAMLHWQPGSEPDLAGYRLLRGGVVAHELAPDAATARDQGLFEGRYDYTLVAFDHAGNESTPAGPVSLVIDTTPPDAQLLRPRAGERVAGVVEIVGTAASADDFREYRLLMAIAPPPSLPMLLRSSPVPAYAALLGQWDTTPVADGTEATIVLEAEDTTGNVARVSVTVLVDHTAPAAPQGLVATVTGDDVELTWQPNGEPDLLGYVLLRDGTPVGAAASAGGTDLRELALPGTSFLDAERPDGSYSYQVVALDAAGNASPPSPPATALIETGPPIVTILAPEEGQRVEGVVTILAEIADHDVIEVRFEARAEDAAEWALIEVDAAEPWTVAWDATALPFGSYEIRAIARDSSGLEGPAHDVRVELTELTPPPSPQLLDALADGGEVTLSWTGVEAPDLAGYHLERSGDGGESWLRLTLQPLDSLEGLDSNVADDAYRYRVLAVDVNGNESEPSPEAAARVFTTVLEQPWTPTAELVAGPVPGRGPEALVYRVELELEQPDGSVVPLSPFDSSPDGGFAVPVIDLARGRSVLRVRLVDGGGHRSKPAWAVIVSAAPPGSPSGFGATVTDLRVALSWDANPEPNIVGYRLARRGESVVLDSPVTPVAATASSTRSASTRGPSRAIDGNVLTWWAPAGGGGTFDPPEWIEVRLDASRVLSGVELLWREEQYAPLDARVEGWSGEVWLPLAPVPTGEATATVSFPRSYATDRLRVLIQQANEVFEPIRLAEFRLLELGLVDGLAFEHEVEDGVHRYGLAGVDSLGLVSAAATIDVPVGDTTVPEAVTLAAQVRGSEVDLTWTASSASDIAGYSILRDGAPLETRLDTGWLAYTDGPLRNGTYRYGVTALDTVGNESAASNEVAVEIAVSTPGAPELGVVAIDSGAVTLAWTPSAEGSAPVAFVVRRGVTSGGPYEGIVVTPALEWVDEELDPTTTYYYVVYARDAAGNESAASNEVSATPADTTAPHAPRLFHPTRPGHPIVVEELAVHVAGISEPGTGVELWRNGSFRSNTMATAAWGEERSGLFVRDADFANWGSRAIAIDHDGALWIVGFPAAVVERVATEVAAARWFNAEEILFATWSGELRRYDLALRYGSTLASLDEIVEIATGPDPEVVFLVAIREGQPGLWQLDLAAGDWTQLAAVADLGELRHTSVSPDGVLLAYQQEGEGLIVLDIESGHSAPLDLEGAGPVAWSPDATALLYTRATPTGDQVWRFDLGGAVASPVTAAPAEAARPLWSPDGSMYAHQLEGEGLVVVEWATGDVVATLGEHAWAEWTGGGPIGLLQHGELVRLVPAGLFRFEDIDLLSGVNVFAAHSRDDAGPESALSEAITVTLAPDALADLELRSSELVVMPPAVAPSDPLRVSVVVRNRGARSAPANELDLRLEGAAGEVWSVSLPVPALEPGGFATIFHDTALVAAGIYLVHARADPGDRVPEGDETNNHATREVRVLEPGLPGLELVSEKARFDPGETVRGALRLIGGGAFRGRLRVRFEDELGFLVATLLDQSLILGFGEELGRDLEHAAVGVFAGRYRLRAIVDDEQGGQVVEAAVTFEIGEAIETAVDVRVDRLHIVRPETVSLEAALRYLAGNALLDGVDFVLSLLDPTGAEVARWSETSGALLPGAEARVSASWASAGAVPGRYRVVLGASHQGRPLGAAEGLFDVVLGPGRLRGTLDAPGQVAAGVPIPVAFVVENIGESALGSLPVRVALRAAPPAGVRASESRLVDLPAGGGASGAAELATRGLGLGSFLLVLEADLPGAAGGSPSTVLLDTAAVTLVDREAPEVELRDPVDGGFVGRNAQVTVRALDRLSGVERVEVLVDGGVSLPAGAIGLDGHDYAARLDGLGSLDEGPHTLQARARDRAGNEESTGVAQVVVDLTPPRITVLGVVDGQRSETVLVPVVEVVEEHPATQSVLLDGRPFVSGSPVSVIGLHRLDVVAADRAGNRAEARVTFEIASSSGPAVTGTLDGVAPETTLGNPLLATAEVRNESAIALVALPVAVTLHAAGSGDEVARLELSLDLAIGADHSQSVSLPTGALVPGDYELRLSADLAQLGGGVTQLDVSSVELVDGTVPVIELLEPADGALTAADMSVHVRAVDAHSALAAVELALDGAAWSPLAAGGGSDEYVATLSGLADGPHWVVVRARDAAGNESQASAAFQVDGTAPLIEITGVVNGQSGSEPVVPVVAATDPHLDTVTLLLDGGPFVSGTEIAEVGPHRLEVEAVDLVGNQAALAVDFEILPAGAPTLALTSPLAGSRVDERAIRIEGVTEAGLEVWLESPEARTVIAGGDGTFAFEAVPLRYGPNRIAVELRDEAGGVSVRAENTVERLRPILVAELRVEVNAGDGGAGPGDVLRYELVLRNDGEGTAHELVAELPLPEHTSWLDGELRVAEMLAAPPAAEHVLEWWVQIDDELPPGVREIVAQAIVRGAELDDLASDDPRLPGAADPTVLPLVVAIEIPALGWPALGALAVLLLALGMWRCRGMA